MDADHGSATSPVPPARAARSGRDLHAAWLFPATYVVHLIEEYFVGGGFPAWTQRTLGLHFSEREFIGWNIFALALMCTGAWLVGREARFRFIELAIAISVLGNAAAHLMGSLITFTYSPGLITSVLVWGPLGWVRLRHAARATSPRGRFAGACIGACVIVITMAVLANQ